MADIDVRIAVVRAAVARTIAEREEMPLARPALSENEALGDALHLTLLGYGSFGWPMGDELLPLSYLMRGVSETVTGNGDEASDSGEDSAERMTIFDIKLNEINAFLHDHLLNVAPPFDVVAPSPTEIPILSEAYEHALRRGEFAGDVFSEPPEAREARALLYTEDEQGRPRKTEMLGKYEEYEAEVNTLTRKVHDLESEGKTRQASQKRMQLSRVEAEWQMLGHRSKVEEALRIIHRSTAEASSENDRKRFLEIFEAGRSNRYVSYHQATIAPLSPLFAEETNPSWSVVELSKEEVLQSVDVEARAAFGLSSSEVEQGTQGLESLRFAYTVAMLDRDWLREEFLEARYWRLPPDEPVLSDGQGRGAIPTIPVRLVFVRGVKARFSDGGAQLVATGPGGHGHTKDVPIVMDLASRPNFELVNSVRADLKLMHQKPAVARQLIAPILNIAEHDATEVHQARSVKNLKKLNTKKTIRRVLTSEDTTATERAKDKTTGSSPKDRLSHVIKPLKHKFSKRSFPVLNKSSFPQKAIELLRRQGSQENTRVKNRNGGKENLTIQGKIKSQGDSAVLDQLTVTEELLGHPEQEEQTLKITRDSSRLLEFTTTVNRAGSTVHRGGGGFNRKYRPTEHKRFLLDGVTLRLRDVDGHIIDEQTFDFSEDHVEVDWHVAATEQTILSLASASTPSLFGYGIRLLPASPNPDPALTWGA